MGVCGDSWAGGRYISTGDVWKHTPRLVAIEAGGVVVAGVGLAWDACSSFECSSKSKPLDTWQERRTPVRVGAGCQGARGTHVHVGVGSMHVMVRRPAQTLGSALGPCVCEGKHGCGRTFGEGCES